MIHDKSRDGWFGGSDTRFIVGNWNTKTFRDWFMTKLGIVQNNIETRQMNAGTHKEGQILDFISPFVEKDKQIRIPELLLRVNLDGNIGKHIIEVKTHSADKPFKVSKAYWQQIQVQMYGYGTTDGEIVSYGLTEEDYRNYFLPIDAERLIHHPISYDKAWVEQTYLPRLKHLAECLKEGRMPVCQVYKGDKSEEE